MMKCWEDSYCVWGNPAVTGRSGRVLRCQRIPPEDHPGAKEEQHLQCNKPKMSLWFIALMNWRKLGISDSYTKEQTEQQTLRSNLTYNHFNSALHENSLELLFYPKHTTTESESDVTVPVWTFPPFDESWGTGNTRACERCVENTPFEKSKLCFLHLITW